MTTEPQADVETRLAVAARDHVRAAGLLRERLDRTPEGAVARVPALLALADAEARSGRIEAAREACREAAAIGRVHEDGAVLADAALALPLGGHGDWTATAEAHALAGEALRLVTDPARRRRLRHLHAATTDPWTTAPPEPEPVDDAASEDERFAHLRARVEARLHVRHAEERLALAAAATALDQDEHRAWGALWEATACAQLGRRVELDAAVLRLRSVAGRLREPVWDWRVDTVLAQLAMLDGYLDRAAELITRALAAAGEPPSPQARFVDLILRSALAQRTGRGLDAIDAELTAQLVGMPFFAQGWRAGVLLAAGRRDEAEAIWRALRPVITRLPQSPVEWLIALAGFAETAVAFEDREAAAVLFDLLEPVSGFQVVGDAQTPNGGPVALLLGRLAILLDDRPAARRLLGAAVRQADAMHDQHHAAIARAALAALGSGNGPLSPRELEVAALIAAGLSNRAIGERLHLSVRTVENHVAHVLAKLDVGSRAAIAAWAARREG